MIERFIIFSCDHPKCSSCAVRFLSIDAAREAGWAVSRDRKHCYCPKCAPKHRNTGCFGVCDWR